MPAFWKTSLAVGLASATLWAQTETKPKADEPKAAPPASASPSTDKTANSAATQPKTSTSSETSMAAKPTPLPGDSTKLEVIKSVKANYPVAAEGKQIQGQVLLKVSVTDTGDVEQVDVVRGDPILAKAAVEAAKKWKFKPFIKNGKAIPVVTQLPFDFAFSDRVTDEKPPKSDDRASGANANSADTLKKIRVSGGVIEGNIIHKVVPVYPQEAKQKLIQGTVLLHAIIDKEGRVAELTPISGPKELIPASIGAVQQWRYRPYVLMGEPIEVETTITVNFNLR